MKAEPFFNPGSDIAIAAGCKCPVIDNGHGTGAYNGDDGNPVFWVSEICPLHNEEGRKQFERERGEL